MGVLDRMTLPERKAVMFKYQEGERANWKCNWICPKCRFINRLVDMICLVCPYEKNFFQWLLFPQNRHFLVVLSTLIIIFAFQVGKMIGMALK